MAPPTDVIPIQSMMGEAPMEDVSPLHSMDEAERSRIAKEVVDWHREGLQAKYSRDLTCEKYMMHVDGENDGQWAEIVAGSAVIVPPRLGSSLRFSHNLLRPLTDNFVAYFTANPLRVVAKAPASRRARDKATVDTMLMNHTIVTQELDAKLTLAMYFAAVYGSCPVHATYRYHTDGQAYHPLWNPDAEGVQDGAVDVWVGDPWSTVYDRGSSYDNIHTVSYDRTLLTEQVKMVFADVPDIERVIGSADLPSASRFQRIARRWQYINQFWSGTSTLATSKSAGENRLTGVICRETEPGLDGNFPEGKLEIVAYTHNSSASSTGTRHSSSDQAVLLHIGPLPGRRLNTVPFYAHHRFDDVYGKPYVADLSPLQQQLNQVVTLRAERLKRYSMPQLIAQTGSVEEDTSVADPDSIMFVTGSQMPQFLNPPQGNPDYDAMTAMIQQQIFRIGGWQAASRGESKAGDPASKVIALARADDTIFGPVQREYKRSLGRLLKLSHALYREYSALPILAEIGGTETQHMVEPWIKTSELSKTDPNVTVTSGFGATPEAFAQVLTNMVVMRGADGEPLMTTAEFWDKYPDTSLRPFRPDLTTIRSRRQAAVKYYIENVGQQVVSEYGEQMSQQPDAMQQLVQIVSQQVQMTYPLLRTDNPQECIQSLDEIVQDPTTVPFVRLIAEARQAMYFEWMAQMATPNMAAPADEETPNSTGTPVQSSPQGQSASSNAITPGSAA